MIIISKTYSNLLGTTYPDAVDTYSKIVDVTISTLPYAILYQNYFQKGDLDSAYQVLSEHPELEQCMINADKINKLIDSIKAIEMDHDNAKAAINTRLDAVSNLASTNSSNISTLNTNVNNISTNVSSLNSNVSTLVTKVQNIENTGSTITKETIGLGNVDNTADANKSVKYAKSASNADNSDTVDGFHLMISTTDLKAGESLLKTNVIYLCYE